MKRPWRHRLILRSLRSDPLGDLALLAVVLCACRDPEAWQGHVDEATHEYIHDTGRNSS